MDRTVLSLSDKPVGVSVLFDPSLQYQEIIGFGGGFTDSTGININNLSPETQNRLIRQYFGPNGSEYTIGRVPMASNDFSSGVYSYDDVDGDFDLEYFALNDADFQYKIPFIQQAIELQKSSGGLRLFACPWSAPSWMKSNGAMQGGGQLRGFEGGRYHITWANYFVKFIESYAAYGIPFWAVGVQNEPSRGALKNYPFQCMFFNATTEAKFVKNQLGPALKSSTASKDTLILAMDDNRDQLPNFPDIYFADSDAAEYTAGLAVHWYADFLDNHPPSVLTDIHNRHPDKFIISTEACAGASSNKGVLLGSYERAEEYARSIIEDLNNFVVGWTDWNMALNPDGGPTWVKNYVDSTIIVMAETDEFVKQPTYYALAHFSKFIKPGAHRVSLVAQDDLPEGVQMLGVVSGERNVVVAMNRNDTEDVMLSIATPSINGKYFNIDLPKRSMITLVW